MSTAGAAAPVLSLRNMHRSFGGVRAVDDVSLDVRAGEVHCLAGENGSGKSTLIKLIAGVLRPHAGAIQVGGRTFAHLTPSASVELGIQVIYQDLSLFPNLTVGDNLALNTLLEHRAWLVRRREVREIADRALSNLGLTIPLDRPLGELPIAERQLVAIGRALVQDAKLIILDEPTTALTAVEVRSLFSVVRRLASHGVALLFVSHKIREMRQISDRFTILRNGTVVESGPAADFDDERIIRAMTGRTAPGARRKAFDSASTQRTLPILRVTQLTGSLLRGVSFDVRRGEILGATGLLGAGQGELALILAGAKRPRSGGIEVDGRARQFRTVRDAVRAGVAYVPEDRLREGLFLDQSIVRNVTAASLRRLRTPWGLLSPSRAHSHTAEWTGRLDIRSSSPGAPARTLSGGNQQRVVLSKWLSTSPRMVVMNGPTVGVDVGAKASLHAMIRDLAAQGLGVLLISDDLEELVEHCDRVLVLQRGQVADELSGGRLTEDALAERLTSVTLEAHP